MGIFESMGENNSRMRITPVPVSVSKVRAQLHDLVVSSPDQPHIRSPLARLHQYPACGGRAQEDETILAYGFSGHEFSRFVHLDPPGLIRSRKI